MPQGPYSQKTGSGAVRGNAFEGFPGGAPLAPALMQEPPRFFVYKNGRGPKIQIYINAFMWYNRFHIFRKDERTMT
ncbi:hypothetical protein DXC92_27700 [Clostridiales bacterium TF09-2AC]|nr:hypothetical protein DXC92_27700 [Clostridiales bacterium TF09-2AC]